MIDRIKEHAGLWTFGIFVVAALGLGWKGWGWIVSAQEAVVVRYDEKLQVQIRGEVGKLEGKIEGNERLFQIILEQLKGLRDDLRATRTELSDDLKETRKDLGDRITNFAKK